MFKGSEFKKNLAACVTTVGVVFGASSASAVPSTELAVVVDASGSINSTEWTLQMQGYHDAFDTLLPLDGSVAVSVIRFGLTSSVVRVMTTISSAADRTALSDFFLGLSQSGNGGNTCISCGIESAEGTFSGNATDAIIDVSTDGDWNRGVDPNGGVGTTGTAEWAVANAATVVNAIGIGVMPDFAHGPDAFALTAASFSDFGDAVKRKIATELNIPIPEPGAVAVFGLGLLGLAAVRRKRKTA